MKTKFLILSIIVVILGWLGINHLLNIFRVGYWIKIDEWQWLMHCWVVNDHYQCENLYVRILEFFHLL